MFTLIIFVADVSWVLQTRYESHWLGASLKCNMQKMRVPNILHIPRVTKQNGGKLPLFRTYVYMNYIFIFASRVGEVGLVNISQPSGVDVSMSSYNSNISVSMLYTLFFRLKKNIFRQIAPNLKSYSTTLLQINRKECLTLALWNFPVVEKNVRISYIWNLT